MAARSEVAAADVARVIVSTRVFDAPRGRVFEAFRDPVQLANWWGPAGFRNSIREFDLRAGGAWRLTMHGPNGADYENESVFMEVAEPERVVFRHREPVHRFEMAMTFADLGGWTELTWRMTFDSAEECGRVRAFVEKANEQNFDRLADHLSKQHTGRPNVSEMTGLTGDRELTAVRVFDAPRELVFAAWSDPERIGRWWGPRGFTTTTYNMDFRPGGVWRFVMHGPDGRDYENRITYTEVIPPSRLAYRHGGDEPELESADFTVTVDFAEEGGKTKLTMRMVFPTPEERDRIVREYGADEGLKQTLERLREVLAEERGAT